MRGALEHGRYRARVAVGLQMSVATSDMSGAGPEQAKAVLIAGPTASGKSALALRLAETRGGAVINADSMQVYRDLRVLTARPTPEEEARAPHRLYGHRRRCSEFLRGTWRRRGRAGAGRGAQGRADADLRRRHRAVFQGADARAVGGAADCGGGARFGARTTRTRRRRRFACRAFAARSGGRGAAQRRRPQPGGAGAGGDRGHRKAARRVAQRGAAAAAADRIRSGLRCSWRRSARRCTRGSTPGLPR